MKQRRSFLLQARKVRKIVEQHYEPGNHQKCYKQVYEKFIRDEFGISYDTMRRYMRVDISELDDPKEERVLEEVM